MTDDKSNKVVTAVLDGTVDGPFEQEFLCGFCDANLTGRVHATAIVSHALEECRARLKAARDEARKKNIKLEEAVSNLRDIVTELEWSASSQDSEMSDRIYGLCPSCGRTKDLGHRASCEIGSAVAEPPNVKPVGE